MPTRALLCTLLLLALAPPCLADGAAAVLMVEDNDVTEAFGIAAYEPFLSESGAYRRVYTLTGRERSNERLAGAIRVAARDHDLVDVFVAVHTTSRPTQLMLDLIPAEARKLRLVYSTACYGADVEREAWERLGAQAVVTHVGINNPVVAMPFFLAAWIRGHAVRPILEAGYREESIASRFLLSLPQGREFLAGYDDADGEPSFLAGSRPVLSGRGGLTITDGLGSVTLTRPEHLRYGRRTGSSLGLVLRAMADDFALDTATIQTALAKLRLPDLPLLPADQVRSLRVVARRDKDSDGKPTGPVQAGVVEAKLAKAQRIPLMQGFELRVGKTVTLEAGAVDPVQRTMRVKTTGVWVAKGLLRYRVTSITLLPDGDGYKARVGGGAWGVIPYWQSLAIGGTRPAPLPQDLSVLDAKDHVATAGIASSIPLAPTQID